MSRSPLASASSMAETASLSKLVVCSNSNNCSLSVWAIMANGSTVNKSLSASSALTSTTKTGTSWSPITSRRKWPSINSKPSGVSRTIIASANPISSRTPRSACSWPGGCNRQFLGLALNSDAFTRLSSFTRSRIVIHLPLLDLDWSFHDIVSYK